MSNRYVYVMLFLLISQGMLLLWPETSSAFRWTVLLLSWCAGALLVYAVAAVPKADPVPIRA
ncbi:hypothetical protein RAC89_13960 [Paenibacillus sp. GD4]|uniref:hypothetical protein n=1 Tax=Paenibacillus sp. GD4 TaxID=3068890 RepID=UPI002796A9A5|nr:hypothetical protein [Paenibacillus sp. GD4]MDQ1911534.1 hypothetical protein [Paenibacillus sp. GD4]